MLGMLSAFTVNGRVVKNDYSDVENIGEILP
jgi:hypothetical protein